MCQKLKPCPFCGNLEPEFERLGDRRQSCIVACGWCGCRLESSDENEHNGSSWNRRHEPKPLAWTKERPTVPGQYVTDIEGDEYSSELTWISERDVACNVKNWSSKMRFFGPIPDAKEAS